MGNKRANRAEVSNADIVQLLADRVPVLTISKRFGIPNATLQRRIAKDKLREAAATESNKRLAVVHANKATAADRVLAKAEAAACGEWDPTPTQMELIKYFIGWDSPPTASQPPQGGGAGEHGPLVVQVFQGAPPPAEHVIEAER